MIVLQVLKITGIVLLAILCLILLLLLITLFTPIHYKGCGEVNAESKTFSANARASWLCRIIRVYFDTENEKTDYRVKLLWFRIYPKPEKTAVLGERKSPASDDPAISKIKYKISGLYDKIRRIDYILHDERDQAAMRELLLRVKKVLWHIRPRKLDANLKLGMDDPASTGEITGIIYSFYPVYTKHLHLEPDFDNKILEGDLKLKGHVQLIFILIAAVRIFFDRDIRRLYRQLQKIRA